MTSSTGQVSIYDSFRLEDYCAMQICQVENLAHVHGSTQFVKDYKIWFQDCQSHFWEKSCQEPNFEIWLKDKLVKRTLKYLVHSIEIKLIKEDSNLGTLVMETCLSVIICRSHVVHIIWLEHVWFLLCYSLWWCHSCYKQETKGKACWKRERERKGEGSKTSQTKEVTSCRL